MKIHLFIPSGLKQHFLREIALYRSEFANGRLSSAWKHLERAHILGQAWPIEHTQAHWEMLKFGFKTKNRAEIIGQLPRLLVGGVKSFVGEIPVGNTGGSDVPPLRSMALPEDLSRILERYQAT